MNVGISAIRTKDTKLNRWELIKNIQENENKVFYIGQESNTVLHQDYNDLNVEFLSVPLQRVNTNPVKELYALSQTKKVLDTNKIDCLLIYGIRTFPTMVLAAKLAGVKTIVCIVNGSGRLFRLNNLKGYITKLISYPMLALAFTLSDFNFFQNGDDLELIKKKNLLLKKNYSTINGSGVNLSTFSVAPLTEEPVFSMISRLTASKGVIEYIEAAKIVKEKYPEAIFYLAGPIDDHTIDTEYLKEAVENRTIILTGKLEDVKPLLKKTRIFVLPSYYPEGTPRSILEAMSMGRPVITTDAPGCKETVDQNVNGFKIPIKNVSKLVEKMLWMIKNPKDVETMGIKSRKICEEKFDVNKVNKIIIDKLIYN